MELFSFYRKIAYSANEVGSAHFFYGAKKVLSERIMEKMPIMGEIAANVWRMVEPVAIQEGLELVDVEYIKGGGGMILRITIDKASGVTIDDCADFSRLVSDILDATDPIPGPYNLEVSSPGINRPLKRASDFSRFAGEKVFIQTKVPLDGRKRFKGILLGMEGDEVSVECHDGRRKIPLDAIQKARLDLI